MLNISEHRIDRDKILKDMSAYQDVMSSHATRAVVFLLSGLFFILFVGLFLPWTQNIRARGQLTTLDPSNREQSIHAVISGRIKKWYVTEGQFLKKGDTVVHIAEMKADYLDPQLLQKSRSQTNAKYASMDAYQNKGKALEEQMVALRANQILKRKQTSNYIEQAKFKVTADSIEFATASANLTIAISQFERQQKLYDQGLKSLTELENRRQKYQDAVNKKIAAENKYLASQRAYVNAQLNLTTVDNEYQQKISKLQSDMMTTLSDAFNAESDYNKLSIQQENYAVRSGFYYITAPQDGYITKAMISGVGETVKEGEELFTLVPSKFNKAAELFIKPMDLPLIQEGARVRLQFDGWPALVFNGWPGMSFGTFAGKIVAYDKVTHNGMFRILVVPDENDVPWPDLLRLGSGVYGIALLNTVPVWYELWRNLNGFPPDFYILENHGDTKMKDKNYE